MLYFLSAINMQSKNKVYIWNYLRIKEFQNIFRKRRSDLVDHLFNDNGICSAAPNYMKPANKIS